MMVRKYQVQYRVRTIFGFRWISFTDFVSEIAAKEKAAKMSHLGVTRVVTVWEE